MAGKSSLNLYSNLDRQPILFFLPQSEPKTLVRDAFLYPSSSVSVSSASDEECLSWDIP